MTGLNLQNKKLVFFIFVAFWGISCGSALRFDAQEKTDLPKTDPKESILNAYNLLKQKRNIIIETVTTNDATKSEYKTITQVSLPDYKTEMFDSNGKKEFEVICVGNDIFTYMDGKWGKSKKDSFDDLVSKISENANSPEAIKNAEFIRSEKLDGVTTYLYQYDFDLDAVMEKTIPNSGNKLPKTEIENKIKVWIDSNGLLRKLEHLRKTEGLKIDVVTIRRLEKYKFDEVVKIEAPKI